MKSTLASLTIFLSVLFADAQKKDTLRREFFKIDSLITEGIKSFAFPGGVLYAKLGDSVLVHRAYGYHTYDSLREVSTENLYDLASITKVTAATLSVMKMYEQGLFQLEDPIRKYFPEIKGKRGKSTFRELLAHQAGWRSWIPYHMEIRDKKGNLHKRYVATEQSEQYDFYLAEGKYLHKDFYKRIKKFIKKAEFDKDQGYVYSGLFFYLVPELVQKLTGRAYVDYLNEEVYSLVGAKSLVFNPLSAYAESQIVPTEIDTFFREQPIHGFVHDEGAIMMRGISGNAGLFGTAEDLGKVWSMLLNRGRHEDTVVFKQSTVDLFTTVQFPSNNNRRGLGFDKPLLEYDASKSSVAEQASPRSYGHTGYTGPIVWADPDKRLLFIFLCNRVYPTRLQRMLYEMNIRPTIHSWLYDAIE